MDTGVVGMCQRVNVARGWLAIFRAGGLVAGLRMTLDGGWLAGGENWERGRAACRQDGMEKLCEIVRRYLKMGGVCTRQNSELFTAILPVRASY
jgi:hypothetical protein